LISYKITGYSLQGKTDLYVELFDETTGIGSSKFTIASAHAQTPNDQTITLELSKNDIPWTGIGKYFITISVNPDRNSIPGSGTEYFYSVDGKNPTLVDITNEVTTLEWSKFIWLRDYMAG
jgi:hypothetical protein